MDTSQIFKSHNTIVTYRCSSQDESDVLRLYHEFSRYQESQIFYLCKNDDQGQPVTSKLIKGSSKTASSCKDETDDMVEGQVRYIELFKLDNYPFYYEEDYVWKAGHKRTHGELVKSE